MQHTAYLSLGSNLGEREACLDQAVRILEERAGKLLSRSAFYYSDPWGFSSDHRFANICIALQTELAPIELLDVTQAVERQLGRTAKSKGGVYADRVIDIDLILIDDLVIADDRLTLPHPLMQERLFVLEPLAAIAPELRHPVLQKSIVELINLLIK
jgi:2-amino-4-hydroxy-6-hydroxymethyldihydropteridine diphosphokinase